MAEKKQYKKFFSIGRKFFLAVLSVNVYRYIFSGLVGNMVGERRGVSVIDLLHATNEKWCQK